MIKIPVTINDPQPAGKGGEVIGHLEIDETKLPGGVAYVFSPAFMLNDYNADVHGYDVSKAELIGLMVIPDDQYQPIRNGEKQSLTAGEVKSV